MHRYLRAVGFSNIQKREEVEALARFACECYQTEETAVNAEGEDYSERRKEFAEHMGLLVRGTYDDNDKYWMDYCIPYLQGMLNGSMKTWRSRDMQKKSLIQDFVMISIWERR